MQAGEPSRTALGAAGHRAAHQVLESGLIFADPLALRILGPDANAAIEAARSDPARRRLRLFIAVRTRFAEDALAAAVVSGVRQLVVLGAGLDTFAYRSPFGDRLRVFEVDHPATQAWKRRRLDDAAIPLPPVLRFAPVDFEHGTLADGLTAAGFDPAQPGFLTWLGVVPYLTEPAVFSTLAWIASLAGGAHVVFDYGNPPLPGDDAAHRQLAERVAAGGEPFRSHFETDILHAKLAALGFGRIEDLGPPAIRQRYFAGRGGPVPDRGGHIAHATTSKAKEKIRAG
jgi:methyltransferase (TIGR00027 family)